MIPQGPCHVTVIVLLALATSLVNTVLEAPCACLLVPPCANQHCQCHGVLCLHVCVQLAADKHGAVGAKLGVHAC